jgi:homocitrate synthase NifV
LLQNRDTYEPFHAEDVGRDPDEFVLGKHSGSASIVHALANKGVRVSNQQAAAVLPKVRAYAVKEKHPVPATEVMKMLCDGDGMRSFEGPAGNNQASPGT